YSENARIWADNASSSPFFGHVYVCLASFRSQEKGNAVPQPLVVATSTDGGDSWTPKQVTPASNNPFNTKQGFGRSGCTVRTDSNGVVYVFADQFAVGTPGQESHFMVKSFDGGRTWTRPQDIGLAVNTCFAVQFDGTGNRCVMDGVGGAREDPSAVPSADIAHGAPTRRGAPNPPPPPAAYGRRRAHQRAPPDVGRWPRRGQQRTRLRELLHRRRDHVVRSGCRGDCR